MDIKILLMLAAFPTAVSGEPAADEGRVDTAPVSSGPYATWGECSRALNEEMLAAVNEYVDEYRASPGASRHVHFDSAYIKAHLIDGDIRRSQQEKPYGTMRQLDGQLAFDADFRAEIDRRWREAVSVGRTVYTTVGLGGLLAVLALLYTYLRVKTPTGKHP